MLSTIILVPLWISLYAIRGQTSNGTIKLGTTILTSQQLLMGLVFISVFIIYISNTIYSIIFIIMASLFCILLHAALRPAGAKANLSKGAADMRMRMDDMFTGNSNNNTNNNQIDPEAPIPYNSNNNQPISPMDMHRANLQNQMNGEQYPQYPPTGSNTTYDTINYSNSSYPSTTTNQLRSRPTVSSNNNTNNTNNVQYPPNGFISAATDAALDAADRTAAELQATLQHTSSVNQTLPRPTSMNKKE